MLECVCGADTDVRARITTVSRSESGQTSGQNLKSGQNVKSAPNLHKDQHLSSVKKITSGQKINHGQDLKSGSNLNSVQNCDRGQNSETEQSYKSGPNNKDSHSFESGKNVKSDPNFESELNITSVQKLNCGNTFYSALKPGEPISVGADNLRVQKSRIALQRTGHLRLGHFLILIIIVLLCIRGSTSGVSLGAHLVCARVAGLTDKQRAMCRVAPSAVAAVGDGLRMAYAECRVQLGGHRWNCTGIGDGNHFGHVMPLATREAAFTYAITSAGVTHALSTACARGEIPACGCNRRRVINPSEQFQWGGCGEAAYGARFARRFLDARELESDARSLMNLHNNRVGRKMVKDMVRRECKCHGVSGSCAVKTCWRALPQFAAVARALRDKYHRAKMVAPHPPPSTHAPNTHLVIRRSRQSTVPGRQPRKNELVFLEISPSYCEPDTLTGSLGTHGRHCNRTARGEEGCETLCCGRGYNTVRSTQQTKCRCRFHWCCRVTCDTCLNVSEVHVCK